MIEMVHSARLQHAHKVAESCADTEAWFSDGQQHGPTDDEREAAIAW
eukprot:CAMPEP_0194536742 /NCGR_PEP_ID=MMETSP0253-20130528/75776_1 /TAXON_ID=2966 /ORGANISM="Noctiluca scintillans" /LENGTH=46 /DNA_ID= /DNA_START= /DNA_END= /DNA_ORIENTATION=